MKSVSKPNHIMVFIGWFLACFGAAAIGAASPPGEWYASLNKPAWNPPSWLFGPVWSALYLMMAVAAWRVWMRGGWKQQVKPLGFFVVQLALNALWSPLFFGLKLPGVAFAEILCLLAMIAATAWVFRPVDRAAAVLLLPYLAWVSFASVLNFTLWRMNS